MSGTGDAIRSGGQALTSGFSINQTTFLFGSVVFAFLFFITARGDLPKWLGLLGLAGSGSQSAATGVIGNGLPVPPSIPAIGSSNSNAGGSNLSNLLNGGSIGNSGVSAQQVGQYAPLIASFFV